MCHGLVLHRFWMEILLHLTLQNNVILNWPDNDSDRRFPVLALLASPYYGLLLDSFRSVFVFLS